MLITSSHNPKNQVYLHIRQLYDLKSECDSSVYVLLSLLKTNEKRKRNENSSKKRLLKNLRNLGRSNEICFVIKNMKTEWSWKPLYKCMMKYYFK